GKSSSSAWWIASRAATNASASFGFTPKRKASPAGSGVSPAASSRVTSSPSRARARSSSDRLSSTLKLLSESQRRAPQKPADGRRAPAHELRDLLEGAILEMAKQKGVALVLLQLLHGAGEPFTSLASGDRRQGARL